MRILLALDGSELSESAIPFALALARRWSAETLLLRVVSPFVPTAPGILPSVAERVTRGEQEAAGPYLEQAQQSFAGLPVRLLRPVGSPRETLVQTAAQEQVDLVIMASQGRSGLKRWVLGSVAESVLRNAPCAVLLVRSSPKGPPTAGFTNVLVPVDGSEASHQVVARVAAYLAEGARVTLLRASDLVIHDAANLLGRETRERYLQAIEAELSQLKLEGTTLDYRVLDGEAADAILTLADEQGCDLIAMSTHGRAGLKRFLLGSVTEKVARHAPCPVLAFPPRAQG